MFSRFILSVGLVMLLTACTPTLRQPEGGGDWEAHRRQAEALSAWQAEGKLGLRSAEQNASALLTWSQHQRDFVIVISGALGVGKNMLRGNDRAVVWTDNRGETKTFDDPGAALKAATGLNVPMSALRYWVRGIPAPTLKTRQLTIEDGLAVGFEQAGWTLEFSRYAPVDELMLPALLRVRRDGVALTIALTRWTRQQ